MNKFFFFQIRKRGIEFVDTNAWYEINLNYLYHRSCSKSTLEISFNVIEKLHYILDNSNYNRFIFILNNTSFFFISIMLRFKVFTN